MSDSLLHKYELKSPIEAIEFDGTLHSATAIQNLGIRVTISPDSSGGCYMRDEDFNPIYGGDFFIKTAGQFVRMQGYDFLDKYQPIETDTDN